MTPNQIARVTSIFICPLPTGNVAASDLHVRLPPPAPICGAWSRATWRRRGQ